MYQPVGSPHIPLSGWSPSIASYCVSCNGVKVYLSVFQALPAADALLPSLLIIIIVLWTYM